MSMACLRRCSWVLLLILCSLSATAFPQCIPKAHTVQRERFSSVTELKMPESKTQESRSSATVVAGIELVLIEQSDRVYATLRDYEGTSTPITASLKGHLRESSTGCTVTLIGRSARGKVEIHGTIRVATFDGTIVRQIGKETFREKVSLKRKAPESNNAIG